MRVLFLCGHNLSNLEHAILANTQGRHIGLLKKKNGEILLNLLLYLKIKKPHHNMVGFYTFSKSISERGM
jgi:hypothetical protein